MGRQATMNSLCRRYPLAPFHLPLCLIHALHTRASTSRPKDTSGCSEDKTHSLFSDRWLTSLTHTHSHTHSQFLIQRLKGNGWGWPGWRRKGSPGAMAVKLRRQEGQQQYLFLPGGQVRPWRCSGVNGGQVFLGILNSYLFFSWTWEMSLVY